MIKEIKREYTYFEAETKIELEIKGKKVIVFYYEKQDSVFHDYEVEIVIQKKNDYSDDEIEEIEEFVKAANIK